VVPRLQSVLRTTAKIFLFCSVACTFALEDLQCSILFLPAPRGWLDYVAVVQVICDLLVPLPLGVFI